MYLQKGISIKLKRKFFLLASWRSLTKRAGSAFVRDRIRVRQSHSRIRIRTNMLRILTTGYNVLSCHSVPVLKFTVGCSSTYVHIIKSEYRQKSLIDQRVVPTDSCSIIWRMFLGLNLLFPWSRHRYGFQWGPGEGGGVGHFTHLPCNSPF